MALQGALDGGLDIPHNQKRFVGYDPDAKEYDADTMRKYIFGGHVAEYMMEMEEEEPEKFQAHFKNYIDNEVEADEEALEELYTGVRFRHLLQEAHAGSTHVCSMLSTDKRSHCDVAVSPCQFMYGTGP